MTIRAASLGNALDVLHQLPRQSYPDTALSSLLGTLDTADQKADFP
jgi:hypothetical protein